MLSRVIEGSAALLDPLERITAGNQSNSLVVWSETLLTSLKTAQKALSSNKTIFIPKPDDQLWIVTDGSVKMHGLGATLYALRDDQLLLAGFFSAKSKPYLLLQPLNTSVPTSPSQVSRPAFSPTASPVCNPSKSSAAASFLPAHGSPHSSPLPADTKSHFAT